MRFGSVGVLDLEIGRLLIMCVLKGQGQGHGVKSVLMATTVVRSYKQGGVESWQGDAVLANKKSKKDKSTGSG